MGTNKLSLDQLHIFTKKDHSMIIQNGFLILMSAATLIKANQQNSEGSIGQECEFDVIYKGCLLHKKAVPQRKWVKDELACKKMCDDFTECTRWQFTEIPKRCPPGSMKKTL